MEIVFVVANMTGGGTERVIANLSNYFIEKGLKITIVMTAGNEIAYELHSQIELVTLGGKTKGHIWKRMERVFRIRKFLKKKKNARVISFGTETNMFTILAMLGLENHLVISERNDPNQCTYKKIRNLIYLFANKYVFQTEDAKMHFCNKIQKKSVVIPNPLAKKLPDSFDGERTKKIVAVGRLTPQKNHKLLLNAFQKAQLNRLGYSLIIYGEGELKEELENEAKKLNIYKSVYFPGFVDNVMSEIKDASMYVLSSDFEGISNSLAEAMAIGIPVISTDCPIGGSKMCIQNGENGILVPVDDVEALSKAMIELAENKEIMNQLAHNAMKLRQMLSIEVIGSRWLEIL